MTKKAVPARKKARGVRRPPRKSPGLPPEVAKALQIIVTHLAGDELPICDCPNLCENVPAGKRYVLVCEGGTVTALAGTQDGQFLKWDQTAGSWDLVTV